MNTGRGAFQTGRMAYAGIGIALFAIMSLFVAYAQEDLPPIDQAPTEEPSAEFAEPSQGLSDPVAARVVGLLDEDGSVLYSILIASGPDQSLGSLTIAGHVPEGATLVGDVGAPPTASYSPNEETGGPSWTLENVDANTILGPFTYRVTYDDPSASTIVAGPGALISWATPSEGKFEIFQDTSPISQLGESGSITVDENGTIEFVSVGDTGIQVMVPPGAVSESTNLTFTRLSVNNDEALPTAENVPEAADMSWCAVVSITGDSPIAFTQPIQVIVPANEALTPGLSAKHFIRINGTETPTVVDNGKSYIMFDGKSVVVADLLFDEAQEATLALGVNAQEKEQRTVSGSQLEAIGFIEPVVYLLH